MTEADHVAAALAESFMLTVSESAGKPFAETKVDLPNKEIWLRYASIAISALDGYRYAEKRKNCQHYNKHGLGSVSSNGQSSYSWRCQECGASGGYEWDPNADVSPLSGSGK